MATIVLTGGGTAGHCIPHLSILPYLKKNFDKIYYIGSANGIEKEIIGKTDIPYFSINCAKLNRSFTVKNFSIPFKVLSGIIQSGKILDKLQPNVIFSKGGYVSIPVVIASHKRKIPIISHESDYSIGLANKLTSKYCKKILTSFPETAINIKNGEFTGPPIRSDIFEINKKDAISFFGFNGEKPILLVTGGSLGAKIINDTLRNSLKFLLPKFDILHICGKNNLDNNLEQKGYVQVEFLTNMEYALVASDICITRAGSNTLFELMSLKKPCVLIPLPQGISRGDQVLNASYFQKLGLTYVLNQSELTPESLTFAITSVYANRFNITRNFDNRPIKNASQRISEIISEYI